MKKVLLSALSLTMVFVLLFALTACGVEGTYADEDGNEIKLEDGKWSMSDSGITLSGPYEKDGDKIIFKVEIAGNTETAFTGTLDGKTLTIPDAGTFKKK